MQGELRHGTGLGRKGSEQNKCRNEGDRGSLQRLLTGYRVDIGGMMIPFIELLL